MSSASEIMEAGLSLGTNEGDRLALLREARRRIGGIPGLRETARSAIYETVPVDVPEDVRHLLYLNAVLIVEWDGTAPELLRHTQSIEVAMGRVRGPVRNLPRPIDIDLLYVGGETRQEPGLLLPHPRWAERAFVLQPLCDVRPHLVLPGANRPVSEILSSLPDRHSVRYYAADW